MSPKGTILNSFFLPLKLSLKLIRARIVILESLEM